MKLLNVVLLPLSCLFAPLLAYAAPICPALTGASSAYYATDTTVSSNCNTIITIDNTGKVNVKGFNLNPYDGNDDNYVGVVNNYGKSVSSLALTGAGIFGFDGDGIDNFGVTGNAKDLSAGSVFGGYGGSDAYFSILNSGSGTVFFLGGIASGGTGYFSLENAPVAGSGGFTGTIGGATPEPSSLILLGTGVLGLASAIRRRIKA